MSRRLPRGPFVLLGLMTLATFGGPVAIVATIRGGSSRAWPPDRPVEWWTFGLVTGLVVALMAACLASGRFATPRASGRRPVADDDRKG